MLCASPPFNRSCDPLFRERFVKEKGTREERPGECGLEISARKVYHKGIDGFKVCVRSFQKPLRTLRDTQEKTDAAPNKRPVRTNPVIDKLHGVIFDLDGTLGNTLPLCIAAFRQAIEPLAARTLTDAEIIATFGPSEEGTIRALAPDHFEAGVSDYLRLYEALHHICPEPFPEILDLLHDLKGQGVRLGLVTGKGPKSAWISLHRFGMADLFEAVEAGDPDGPCKADGIRHVLAQWKMEPSEVVYVGDSPSDVTAARAAGIGVVGAAWAETTDQELLAAQKPDAMLMTVEELRNWLDIRIQ